MDYNKFFNINPEDVKKEITNKKLAKYFHEVNDKHILRW